MLVTFSWAGKVPGDRREAPRERLQELARNNLRAQAVSS